MSALAGYFSLRQERTDWKLVRRLERGIARGDTPVTVQECAYGVQMLALASWEESRSGGGLYSTLSGCQIALSGRIDNLRDLRYQLAAPGDRPSAPELIALGIERWGLDECLKRLIGEWVAAIFDPSRRCMMLARDFSGVRHLYYTVLNGVLIWSSILPSLRSMIPDASVQYDYLAKHFSLGIHPTLTPYRDVFDVNPAHFVRWDGMEKRETEFYRLPLEVELHYKHDADYEEHFRSLFLQCVADRLQTSGLAAVDVSGGLDSSSVACAAQRLIEEGQVACSGLRPVSVVLPSWPEADESRFVDAVEQHCGFTVRRFNADHYLDYSRIPDPTPGRLARGFSAWAQTEGVSRYLAAEGVRVYLTGAGGDGTGGQIPDHSATAADFLKNRDWFGFLRHAKAWSKALNKPLWMVMAHASRHLMGAEAQDGAILRRALRKGQGGQISRTRDLSFTPDFARRCCDMGRSPQLPAYFYRPARPSAGITGAILYRYLRLSGMPMAGEINPWPLTSPFEDRRLLELVISIPPSQMVKPGETRSLMRRALAGLVPQRILQRKSKGNPTGYAVRQMRPVLRHLLGDPRELRLSAHGCVDEPGFRSALGRLYHGSSPSPALMRRLIEAEVYLRCLDDGSYPKLLENVFHEEQVSVPVSSEVGAGGFGP